MKEISLLVLRLGYCQSVSTSTQQRELDEANSAESDDCVKEPYLPVKECILVFGSMAVIAYSSLFAWQYYLERSKRQGVVSLVDEIVVWQKENYAKNGSLILADKSGFPDRFKNIPIEIRW